MHSWAIRRRDADSHIEEEPGNVCFRRRMESFYHDSQRTTHPIVTGQSVLAICYKDGIMMASDTQLCYGNQQKFKDVPRLFSLELSNTLLGYSGEYSDVQHIMKRLEASETTAFVESNAPPRNASHIAGYLCRLLYNQRNRFNPLWTQIVIGGFDDDQKPFLSYVDYHGTHYTDSTIATGFGSYFAIPLLRKRASPDMTESDARTLLEDCMKILFARDCRAYNKIQIATITKDGTCIGTPYTIHPNWHFSAFVQPTSSVDLCSASW